MAPSLRDDPNLPHDYYRVRVHGPVFIAQPYKLKYCSGPALLVDLLRGTVRVGDKPIDLKADYTVAYAILGVQHFRTCSAVAIVTAAEEVAVLNSEAIHKVTSTAVFCADGKPPKDKNDARLFKLLKQGVDPLSVAAGMYFSPRTNVTASLQQQHTAKKDVPLWKRSATYVWWNQHLSQPLCDVGADPYIMPCILGFVRQIASAPVAAGVKRDTITVTLIARRAPTRAGTRHWRRGADAAGHVANYVETEQVLETGTGELTSTVQIRGSIPMSWSQVPNTRYKPKTAIPDFETYSRTPFQNHARTMTSRYGAVAGVNLANQHGTEGKLGEAYAHAVEGLPADVPFNVFAFDFHKECGAANYKNMEKLWQMLAPTLQQHGSFRTRGELGRVRTQQKGVLRTNCIDCLDRTNVVQAMVGRKALEGLLRELLLLDDSGPEDLNLQFPHLERAFRILWADHGDAVSWQYAGTGALKSGFTRTGVRSPMGLVDDGWKSAVRYYMNNYEDGHKQDAIDLITGTYEPRTDPPPGPPLANGAPWVLLSVSLILLSVSSAAVAAYSKWVTVTFVTLPLLAAGAAAFAAVLAMGKKVTCRPLLRPDLTEPWVVEQGASSLGAAGGGATRASGSKKKD